MTTPEKVKTAFRDLCRVLDKHPVISANETRATGDWRLDSVYDTLADYSGSGYRIVEVGSHTYPLQHKRLSAETFVAACEMAVAAIKHFKRGQLDRSLLRTGKADWQRQPQGIPDEVLLSYKGVTKWDI